MRGAVVLLEADDPGLAKILFEIEDVAEIRAAPFVNRLVGVTDDGNVSVRLGKPPNQQVLRPVGVLVLVDHHILELVRIELAHLLRRFEQLDRLQQEIVEIQRVGVLQRLQIALVDLRRLLLADVPAAAQRFRPFHPVLRLADARQRHSWRHQLVVDAELALGLLHDGDLIGRVINHKVARQPNLRRLPPEQPRAQRVERREPHARSRRPNE